MTNFGSEAQRSEATISHCSVDLDVRLGQQKAHNAVVPVTSPHVQCRCQFFPRAQGQFQENSDAGLSQQRPHGFNVAELGSSNE
jgi:hypothetical protein